MKQGIDNRKFKRSMFVFPVRIGVLNESSDGAGRPAEYFHAFSDNISEGGLKIDLKKDLPLNTRLDLRFDLIIKDKISMLNTKAEIRWCRKKSNGFFEYGIIFDTLPQEYWEIINAFMREYCK
jgi:hypothetical protein